MRALVAGGAGFIGSSLVDRLLAEGHGVDVVDDLSTGRLANLAEARSDRGAELRIHQLDVASPEIVDLVERRAPEVVFHLVPVRTVHDVVSLVHVLEGARLAGTRKVVLTSGWWIDGETSARGAAARSAVEHLRLYREAHGVEFVVLALGTVYGPRRRDGVVALFAESLLAGEPATVHGDGAQTRDFLYVDDTVDALVRAAERGSGLVVPVGRGVETSIEHLAATMTDAAGGRAAPRREGAATGPAKVTVDPSRARIHLGWEPWTSLEEGVAQTLRWHDDRT